MTLQQRWNRYIDGPSLLVRYADAWLAHFAFPLMEAIAASLGGRVPEPWDENPKVVWVRYWRTWILWLLCHGFFRGFHKLKPPIGPPLYMMVEPGSPATLEWGIEIDQPTVFAVRRAEQLRRQFSSPNWRDWISTPTLREVKNPWTRSA